MAFGIGDLLGPIGGILGGIGSIAGGIMGANQSAANNQTQLEIANRNIELQREFAQQGIRWRVMDAQSAGLHPLAAIGAQGASFTPVSATFTQPDNSWMGNAGKAFGQAGQDISRAIKATQTADERMDSVARTLQLNRMGLENELLRAQIDKTNQVGPPMPTLGSSSPGGGNSGDVRTTGLGTYETKPHEVTTYLPNNQATAAGPAGPQVKWALGTNGALQPFPPKDLGTEDELGAPLMFRWLTTQAWNKPDDRVWKHAFPQAVDVRWDTSSLGWVPVYSQSNMQDYQFLKDRGLLRSSGARPGFGDPLYPRRGQSGRELPAPYLR